VNVLRLWYKEAVVKHLNAKPILLAAAVFGCETLTSFDCVGLAASTEVTHAKHVRAANLPGSASTTKGKSRITHKGGRLLDKIRVHRSIVSTKSSSRKRITLKPKMHSRTNRQAARRQKHGGLASVEKRARKQFAMLGLASFYWEDTQTASGERFDEHELSAAHPTLPFGTRLRVTNVRNGRCVTVRVNDRGPFTKGRVVDVTLAAAKALGMVDEGVAEVRLDIID
jgi:rare lipoprotein A